jgi:uncharacterized YigZ family protein
MNVPLSYASAEFTVKGSRFLAEIFPITEQAEVRALLKSQKAKYADATHVVHAFVCGKQAEIMGMSDDGEPGGTAGNPILEAIKKNGLTNIVVVVTRYFGGIKLGAGGLIRAYSHAAAIGIEAATILEMTPFAQLDVAISYEHLATIEHYMRQKEIRSKEADYAEGVTLHLLISPAETEKISEDITNLTAGRAQIKSGDEELIAIPVK